MAEKDAEKKMNKINKRIIEFNKLPIRQQGEKKATDIELRTYKAGGGIPRATIIIAPHSFSPANTAKPGHHHIRRVYV